VEPEHGLSDRRGMEGRLASGWDCGKTGHRAAEGARNEHSSAACASSETCEVRSSKLSLSLFLTLIPPPSNGRHAGRGRPGGASPARRTYGLSRPGTQRGASPEKEGNPSPDRPVSALPRRFESYGCGGGLHVARSVGNMPAWFVKPGIILAQVLRRWGES
jgi:hypothetical protein